MKVFDRIADALITRAQHTPYWHLTGYMERFWLSPYRDPICGNGCGPVILHRRPLTWLLQRFDVAVRVHHILQSDDDRAFHDHPWSYMTIVLRGGYFEVTPIYDASGIYKGVAREWVGAGSIRFRRAKSWHRLEIPEGRAAWTLFITFKKQQAWGFLEKPATKIYYRDYLERGE